MKFDIEYMCIWALTQTDHFQFMNHVPVNVLWGEFDSCKFLVFSKVFKLKSFPISFLMYCVKI